MRYNQHGAHPCAFVGVLTASVRTLHWLDNASNSSSTEISPMLLNTLFADYNAARAPQLPPLCRAQCWGCDNGSASAAMRRLLVAAEAAKVALSTEASTLISTPSCGALEMQADQLAAVTAPLLRRLGPPLSRVAAETFLTWSAWCVASTCRCDQPPCHPPDGARC